MNGRGEITFGQVLLVVVLVVVAIFGLSIWKTYGTVQTFDGQFVRTIPENNHNTMIVLKNTETGESETFDNEDNIWFWKFNSRDYLALETGKKYRFMVNGLRWPIFSMSRNVINAVPLSD